MNPLRIALVAEDYYPQLGGVPEHVHECAAARVVIPLRRPARSLNVAVAGAIALAEALRQTSLFPEP